MPIITKPVSISKNVPASFSLDKSALASLSKVSANPWYGNTSNWKKVTLNYVSSLYNEVLFVTFDATQASPTGTWLAPSICQDVFNIDSIYITDFANGTFIVPASDLTTSEFKIDMGVIAPFYTRNFSSPSSVISGESLSALISVGGNNLNLNGTANGSTYYGLFYSGAVPAIVPNPAKNYKIKCYIGVNPSSNFLISLFNGTSSTVPRSITPTEISQGYFELNSIPGAASYFFLYPSSSDASPGTIGISKYELIEI